MADFDYSRLHDCKVISVHSQCIFVEVATPFVWLNVILRESQLCLPHVVFPELSEPVLAYVIALGVAVRKAKAKTPPPDRTWTSTVRENFGDAYDYSNLPEDDDRSPWLFLDCLCSFCGYLLV